MSQQSPPRTTVQLDEETKAILDALTDDTDGPPKYDSGSAAVREALRRFDEIDDLEADLKEARARRDELRKKLQHANSHTEDVTDLTEYVAEERSLRSQEAAREQRRRSVSILTRTWWRITGEPPLNGTSPDPAEG